MSTDPREPVVTCTRCGRQAPIDLEELKGDGPGRGPGWGANGWSGPMILADVLKPPKDDP